MYFIFWNEILWNLDFYETGPCVFKSFKLDSNARRKLIELGRYHLQIGFK